MAKDIMIVRVRGDIIYKHMACNVGIVDQKLDYSRSECYQVEDVNNPGCFMAVDKDDCEDITHHFFSLRNRL